MKIEKAKIEDAEGIAKVSIKTWQSTYKGIIEQSFLDSMSLSKISNSLHNFLKSNDETEIIFVAKDNKKIIGFVGGGVNTNPPELRSIYVLPEYQGKGIGKRLFKTFISEIINQGFDKMIIGGLHDNKKSTSIYEHLGGKFINTRDFEKGGKIYKEDVFEYTDLQKIL